MADKPKMVLYCNAGCPFARRGMIAMREKGLECEEVFIPLKMELAIIEEKGLAECPRYAAKWPGKSKEELIEIKEAYKRDINAAGEVPTLVIDGEIIPEADVVAEFLEDRFPENGNRLMPVDAVARSKVRRYLKILGGPTGVGAMYGTLMNQDPTQDEACRTKLYQGLEAFAKLASETGPYFLGDQFSLADLMLMPMYDQFRMSLPHYRGIDLFPSDTAAHPWVPRMQQWAEALEKRESFAALTQGPDIYVAGYTGYAGARGVSEFGK